MTEHISPHDALIWTMVCLAAVDGDMTNSELHAIGEVAKTLPAFKSYDVNRLPDSARACGVMLHGDGGVDEVIRMIAESLPQPLHDTAYVLACEIASIDARVEVHELRLLQLVRKGLKVDPLTAAAIERGIEARFRTL